MIAGINRRAVALPLLAALSVIAFFARSLALRPPVEKHLHSEVGRHVATEALKLLKPPGKIHIITRDTDSFPQPALNIVLAALQLEFNNHGAKIDSIHRLQRDPIRPNEVSSGDFYEFLRRSQKGDVIISLLGPPILSSEDRRKLKPATAPVVALCTGNSSEILDIDALLKDGILHAAIISKKLNAPLRRSASFEDLYGVVRKEL